MRFSRFVGMLLVVATVVVHSVSERSVAQEFTTRKVELKAGNTIEYGYIEPDDFDPSKEYPVLLALPPGAQNRQMVKASFDLYWNQGGKNGWVIIAPAAPDGKFFNKGSEVLVPSFLEMMKKRYKPVGGKFHLAGVSNGGTSAFRIAGLYPDEFHSLIAMPGFPVNSADKKRLAKLKDIPVALFAGAKDTRWVNPMAETAEALKEQGTDVTFEKIAGQGHVIQKWQDGKKLFELLNKWNDQATK